MRVEFNTRAYQFSHGKAPRGFGCWAFDFGQGDVQFCTAMTFADAKKWAAVKAREMGARQVEVCP